MWGLWVSKFGEKFRGYHRFMGQINWFAKKLSSQNQESQTYLHEKHPQVSSSYKAGLTEYGEATGKTYESLGEITPEEGDKFKVAKEEEVAKSPYWPTFGNWSNLQIFSWFIIGDIIICWLSKLSIPQTLIESTKATVPIIIGYVLMNASRMIVMDSGMPDKIKGFLLTDKVTKNAAIFALIGIFI